LTVRVDFPDFLYTSTLQTDKVHPDLEAGLTQYAELLLEHYVYAFVHIAAVRVLDAQHAHRCRVFSEAGGYTREGVTGYKLKLGPKELAYQYVAKRAFRAEIIDAPWRWR
jgi:hypothetical protein